MADLEDLLGSWGEPRFRAAQVLDWVYSKRVDGFDRMANVPARLRLRLEETFELNPPRQVRLKQGADSTRKLLFQLGDGALIETVLIPASMDLFGEKSDRLTLCVSTQVGCAYGCKFCASGLRGWSRNLSAGEIVGQIIAAENASGDKVNNLVFMGMGEPLANFEELQKALRILNAPWGVGIGARHMTISTSGLVPRIRELAEFPMQVRLAVSLHGASDDVRERIMPVNRKYPVAELMDACAYFAERRRQFITLEYILIEGVNDSSEQASLLAGHAGRLRAKVNLIPYNRVEGLPWKRPSEAAQRRFLGVLHGAGIKATLRREKGHEIDAACGQLRLQELDRQG